MTDRELLERAAKAAGLVNPMPAMGCGIVHAGGLYWNPLTDDGDALRLAVKLGFHVSPRSVEVWQSGREVLNIFVDEHDTEAATRRAIVRASAAMVSE